MEDLIIPVSYCPCRNCERTWNPELHIGKLREEWISSTYASKTFREGGCGTAMNQIDLLYLPRRFS
jgi:hypothetical protein